MPMRIELHNGNVYTGWFLGTDRVSHATEPVPARDGTVWMELDGGGLNCFPGYAIKGYEVET